MTTAIDPLTGEPIIYRTRCPKHGRVRAYAWTYHGKKKDSLVLRCHICRKMEEWQNYHTLPGFREKKLAASKAWKKSHPRRVRRVRKEYELLHREETLMYGKLYRQANRERLNATKREAYRLKKLSALRGREAVVSDKGREALPHA